MLLFKNSFTLFLKIQVFRRDAFSCVYVLSCVQFFATLWTVACQTPLSMRFPRQEYWSGLPFPTPGDLLCLLCLQAESLPLSYLRICMLSPVPGFDLELPIFFFYNDQLGCLYFF